MDQIDYYVTATLLLYNISTLFILNDANLFELHIPSLVENIFINDRYIIIIKNKRFAYLNNIITDKKYISKINNILKDRGDTLPNIVDYKVDSVYLENNIITYFKYKNVWLPTKSTISTNKYKIGKVETIKLKDYKKYNLDIKFDPMNPAPPVTTTNCFILLNFAKIIS